MMRWVLVAVLVGASACRGGTVDPTDTSSPGPPDPTDSPAPTDTAPPEPSTPLPPPAPEAALELPASVPTETSFFTTSDRCAECHSEHPQATAMRDEQGNTVAPFDLWRGSMMANAGRDPLWRAVVSAEIAATPGAATIIGQRCMSCHAPMAYSQSVLEGVDPPLLEELSDGSTTSQLALDGVSCTLCHQIESDGLGTEASWKGNYTIDPERRIFGPHSSPRTGPMDNAGWPIAVSSHINDAHLCGTCHTLITEALEPDGTPNGGTVMEQAPLLEMLNSNYASSSCQSCHLPSRTDADAAIETPIARRPNGTDFPNLPSRSMGRHILVGGNTLVPQLLRDNRAILQPSAPDEAFDATIASARAQLAQRTANLVIEDERLEGGALRFTTRISSLTGHKFPTGIPLRRAWLRVQVVDADGATVFLSGDHDDQGRILVGGQVAPFEQPGGPIEPHHTAIQSDSQVQIYEAVLSDIHDAPTFLLLRAAGYAKDNRLLPAGWNPNGPEIDRIGPVGTDGDADYTQGGDTLTWEVDTSGHPGPFMVDVQLLYQPLAQRFAEELFLANTPETEALRAMLERADRSPEEVARATALVH